MIKIDDEMLARLRKICLTLPETAEDHDGVGSPAFKVKGKIFAMHHGDKTHAPDARSSVWCKAPRGFQESVMNSDPEHFFVPPYVGHHGWIGMWLDVEQDWEFITACIHESYRMSASKKLAVQAGLLKNG